MRAFNLLANGMGGLDLAGLPLAMALAGETDVELFVHRLMTIKTHRPPVAARQPGH